VFDRAKVDLTAVYRGLHIFDTLGISGEFKTYYTENRKVRAP